MQLVPKLLLFFICRTFLVAGNAEPEHHLLFFDTCTLYVAQRVERKAIASWATRLAGWNLRYLVIIQRLWIQWVATMDAPKGRTLQRGSFWHLAGHLAEKKQKVAFGRFSVVCLVCLLFLGTRASKS